MSKQSDDFRGTYAFLTGLGMSMTKAEFCYLVVASERVFSKSVIAAAVAWLRETGADLSHLRRAHAGHKERL
jgi:hypothetical protein